MMITPFTQYLGLNILLLLEELIAYKFRDQDLKKKMLHSKNFFGMIVVLGVFELLIKETSTLELVSR